jgi:hypothetical protein
MNGGLTLLIVYCYDLGVRDKIIDCLYVYLLYFLCATHDLLFLFSCYHRVIGFRAIRQVGYHAISLVEMEVVLYLEIMTSSMGVFSTDMHLYRVNSVVKVARSNIAVF